MNPRSRFLAALAAFAAWVATLSYLASTSSEKPRERAPARADATAR